MGYLTVALSSGKLFEPTIELLKKMGINSEQWEDETRKLAFFDHGNNLKFIITRPKDNPTYVEYGAADAGIVGKDILMEEEKDVYELLDLKFGDCKLVLAGLREKGPDFYKNGGHYLRVATKYPHITIKYFQKKKKQVEVIKLYGSIELAPCVGLSDMIVDVVSPGRTLRENKLIEVEQIFPISARFIVNRISYKTKHKKIKKFVEEIKKIIYFSEQREQNELN